MGTNRRAVGRLTFLLFLTIVVGGCFLAPNREINLRVVRTNTGGAEVTVTYRMPPPKEGKVYVLWIVNPDLRQQVKVGTVTSSSQLRAIRTNVDFWATGAVISIESSPNVQQMSDTWVLVSGQVGSSQSTTFTGVTTAVGAVR